MAEENDINETIKFEERDDLCGGDQNEKPFVLLMKATQANGKPLPIGVFTGRAMVQMLHEIAGVNHKEVAILTDQEVVMELQEE